LGALPIISRYVSDSALAEPYSPTSNPFKRNSPVYGSLLDVMPLAHPKVGTMNKQKPWVGLTVRNGYDGEEWFGELDCSLEEFFAAPNHAFVRLNHACWLEAPNEFSEPSIMRNEESHEALHHYVYIRKDAITMVRPLRVPLIDAEDAF